MKKMISVKKKLIMINRTLAEQTLITYLCVVKYQNFRSSAFINSKNLGRGGNDPLQCCFKKVWLHLCPLTTESWDACLKPFISHVHCNRFPVTYAKFQYRLIKPRSALFTVTLWLNCDLLVPSS